MFHTRAELQPGKGKDRALAVQRQEGKRRGIVSQDRDRTPLVHVGEVREQSPVDASGKVPFRSLQGKHSTPAPGLLQVVDFDVETVVQDVVVGLEEGFRGVPAASGGKPSREALHEFPAEVGARRHQPVVDLGAARLVDPVHARVVGPHRHGQVPFAPEVPDVLRVEAAHQRVEGIRRDAVLHEIFLRLGTHVFIGPVGAEGDRVGSRGPFPAQIGDERIVRVVVVGGVLVFGGLRLAGPPGAQLPEAESRRVPGKRPRALGAVGGDPLDDGTGGARVVVPDIVVPEPEFVRRGRHHGGEVVGHRSSEDLGMALDHAGVPVPALSQGTVEFDQPALVLERRGFGEAVVVGIPLALPEEMAGGDKPEVSVVRAGGCGKGQSPPVVVSGRDVRGEARSARVLQPDVDGAADRARSQERGARPPRDVDAGQTRRGQRVHPVESGDSGIERQPVHQHGGVFGSQSVDLDLLEAARGTGREHIHPGLVGDSLGDVVGILALDGFRGHHLRGLDGVGERSHPVQIAPLSSDHHGTAGRSVLQQRGPLARIDDLGGDGGIRDHGRGRGLGRRSGTGLEGIRDPRNGIRGLGDRIRGKGSRHHGRVLGRSGHGIGGGEGRGQEDQVREVQGISLEESFGQSCRSRVSGRQPIQESASRPEDWKTRTSGKAWGRSTRGPAITA